MIVNSFCFIKKTAILLFVLTMVCACQSFSIKSVGMHDSMVSYWQEIVPAESRVSVVDKGDYIKARREKHDVKRNLFSQAFLLRNGSMIFEEQAYAQHGAFLSPAEQIVRRYSKHNEILSRKLRIQEEDVVKKTSEGGDIYYTYVQSQSLSCYLFFRYSADSDVGPGVADVDAHYYQAVTGSFCAPPGGVEKEELEVEMLDFVSDIYFDDGDFTRKQIFYYGYGK